MLISIFFQPFWLLNAQTFNKLLSIHCKQSYPSFGNVLRFIFTICCYFFITKKFKSFEDVLFVIWVVDCSNLPFSIGQRPFIVLSDVNMILLDDLTFEDDGKVRNIAAGFGNNLTIEVKSKLTILIKSLWFFIFQVEFKEESTLQQIWYLISGSHFNVVSEFLHEGVVNIDV